MGEDATCLSALVGIIIFRADTLCAKTSAHGGKSPSRGALHSIAHDETRQRCVT